MHYSELAKKVKEKYPQYGEMDDFELANKIVQKHPQYNQGLDWTPHENGIDPVSPLGYAADAGKLAGAGLEKVAEKSADYGNAGGIVGIPALMASEALPKTDMQVAGAMAGPVLGKAFGGAGEAVENLGTKAAKAGYRYAGLSPAKAELATQTASEALPEATATMNKLKNTLGVTPFGSNMSKTEMDQLGTHLIDRGGMDVVSNPGSSYQDLHNVVDAVSQYGSDAKHWALGSQARDAIVKKASGEVENASYLQEVLGNLTNQAKEIESHIADVSNLQKYPQNAGWPAIDNYKKVLANVRNTIENITPNADPEAAMARLQAAQKLAGNRKDIAIGKVGEETSKLLPSGLNMTQAGLGALGAVGGAAMGHPGAAMSMLGPMALLKSPLLMKGAIKGTQAAYQGATAANPYMQAMYNALSNGQ